MPQLWKRWRLVLFVAFVMGAQSLMAAQCAEKFEIPVNITKDMEFDLDIDKYVQPALKEKNIDPKDGKIPQGSPPITIPVEFSQTFDISDNEQIKKHGQVLSGAQVNSILVSANTNTLSTALPGFDILMGNKGSKPGDVVADLSGIPAGKTGQLEDLIKGGAQTSTIESYILKFAFEVGIRTSLVLKAGDTIPTGKAALKVTFNLTVKVKPLKF